MSQNKLAILCADFETSLATKMAIGATTATLLNATDDDGVALPTGRYFLTLDGNNSSKEHISCTLTSTSLTDIKTLSRQGVETSGCLRAHRVGCKVVLTDWAHLKVMNDLLDGTTKFNASTPLEYDGTTTPTTANQIVPKSYVDGVAIAGGAKASTSVYGIAKTSVAPASAVDPIVVGTNDGRIPTQDENNALVGTSGTAPSVSNKFVDNADTTGTGLILRQSLAPKFGGTGADGALTITTGTTTVDLGAAAYVVKNYSSISITGDGKLAFSNPHAGGTIIVIKSQGNVTLTSSAAPMIDASGMGAVAGTAVNASNDGNDGTVANYIITADSSNGKKGAAARTAGLGGVIYTTKYGYPLTQPYIYRKYPIWITAGSGGASGGAVGGASGVGGRGGGGLYIECGGAWNFTTALGISVAGKDGGTATTGGAGTGGSGGGSGGAGGMLIILYNSLTANSGTFNISGGNGGNGAPGVGNGNNGFNGAGGAGGAGMYAGAGGAGGIGGNSVGPSGAANGSSGTVSSTTSGGAGTGGTGGATVASGANWATGGGGGGGGTAGEYLFTKNTEF